MEWQVRGEGSGGSDDENKGEWELRANKDGNTALGRHYHSTHIHKHTRHVTVLYLLARTLRESVLSHYKFRNINIKLKSNNNINY